MAVDTTREIVVRAASSLGYSLKPEQEQAILAFVSGNDVFIALPTSYGKSLCSSVLPRTFYLLRGVQSQSLVMVVSPFVGLMTDQAASFATSEMRAHDHIRLHCVIIAFRWHNSFYGRCPDPLSCEGLARETNSLHGAFIFKIIVRILFTKFC